MEKSNFQENEIIQKVLMFFKGIGKFFAKHKILTTVMSVILAFVVVVAAFVYDKLSRIQYDDGSNYSSPYTQAPLSTTLAQNQMNNSSGYLSYLSADGSTVFVDGSYISSTGAAVLCDGTTIYPSGVVVFQDGSYITGSGIHVSSDGIATFSNGSQLHITLFTIEKSGRIVSKAPDGTINIVNNVPSGAIMNSSEGAVHVGTSEPVTTQPTTNNTTTDYGGDFDAFLQGIYNGEYDNDVQQELIQNDQLIEQNLHNNEIWYSDDVVNILLLGIDNTWGDSDAMIIVSINKNDKSLKMVSLSRAAYVAIEGYRNSRLSHAHRYGGPQLTMKTIEKNYKIRIDNYVSTTFDNFKNLIDALGGVTIGLTQAELNTESMQYVLKLQGYTGDLVPAAYPLDGNSALNYVRLRKIEGENDRQRTQRQRNVLEAIAKQAMDMSFFELNSVYNKVAPYVTTDLTKTEILGQMANVATYLSGGIEQYVLPHKSSALQMVDDYEYEVITVNWEDEVAYTHNLFYSDVEVKYITD